MLFFFFFAALMKFIQRDHIEGLAEATRVFGNLSREKPARDFLVHQKSEFSVCVEQKSGQTCKI